MEKEEGTQNDRQTQGESRDHTQHDGAQNTPGSGVVDRLTSGPGTNPSEAAQAGPGGDHGTSKKEGGEKEEDGS